MGRYKSNKEAVILRESARLFREKGYLATSIVDIASAAGLLKASLYHYFDSKEQILYAVSEPSARIGLELLRKIVGSKITPKEKLRKALLHHFETIDQYANTSVTLTSQEMKYISDDMRAELSALNDEYIHLWQDIVAEGVSAGQFRSDMDIKVIVFAILGMCNFVGLWFRNGGSLSLAEVAEQYIAFINRALCVNEEPETAGNPVSESGSSA